LYSAEEGRRRLNPKKKAIQIKILETCQERYVPLVRGAAASNVLFGNDDRRGGANRPLKFLEHHANHVMGQIERTIKLVTQQV
jgi:hypothetical protein